MKRYHRLEDLYFAAAIAKRKKYVSVDILEKQKKILYDLIHTARDTSFGQDHRFSEYNTSSFASLYADFVQSVPVKSYEAYTGYMDRIKQGERNVLRPGTPKYLATTSGTTSGKKYIPLTHASTKDHIITGTEAIVTCLAQLEKKPRMGVNYFLSGSPDLSTSGSQIPYGRLSGIVHKETPALIRMLAQSPSPEINRIEDFAEKIQKTVEEHVRIKEDITLISGIPSYFEQYAKEVLKQTGAASLKEVFPNLALMVTGGTNLEPYRTLLQEMLGDPALPVIETYPASEGFIAYQDNNYTLNTEHTGLKLKADGHIFFECIVFDEKYSSENTRLWLGEVELGKQYSLILTSNAGLWSYELGDVVEFTSLDPFRIKVVGRTKHGLSRFGEHVIGSEISALQAVGTTAGLAIVEYTVSSLKSEESNMHQRFIESSQAYDAKFLQEIAQTMDQKLQDMNEYYRDLREAKTLACLRIYLIKPGSSTRYLQSKPGAFDPQMKLPRCQDKRDIAEYFLDSENNCLC